MKNAPSFRKTRLGPLQSEIDKLTEKHRFLAEQIILRADDAVGCEALMARAESLTLVLPQWMNVINGVSSGQRLVDAIIENNMAAVFGEIKARHTDMLRLSELTRAYDETGARIDAITIVDASLIRSGHIDEAGRESLVELWESTTASSALQTHGLADWRALADSPVEYLFSGTYGIERGKLGTISALDGLGKSRYALHIAVSLASGCCIFPGLHPVRNGKVLYLSAEDSTVDMSRRIADISKAHQNRLPYDGLSCLDRIRFPDEDPGVLFHEDHGGTIAWTGGGRRILRSLMEYDLLIVDTWASYSGLSNENENGATGAAGRLLQVAAERTDTTILVIHHAAKTARNNGDDMAAELRGASALSAARRWGMYLSPRSDGTVLVRHTKQSYGPTGPPFEMRSEGAAFVPSVDTTYAAIENAILAILEHGPVLKTDLLNTRRRTQPRNDIDAETGLQVEPTAIQRAYKRLVESCKIVDCKMRMGTQRGGSAGVYVCISNAESEPSGCYDDDGEAPF